MTRYTLQSEQHGLVIWDFGSAVAYHRLHLPRLEREHSRAAWITMRGAIPADGAVIVNFVADIRAALEELDVPEDAPAGVDIADVATLRALQAAKINGVDGQQVMLAARQRQSADEVSLLTQAAPIGRRGLSYGC